MDEQQKKPTDKQKEEHYDVVSDIKIGHAKVPNFLKLTYATIIVWSMYYVASATPINDRVEGGQSVSATPEAGKEIFSVSCAGCHNATAERKVGPGLLGVHQRLGDQGLDLVLQNGRPDKGMPKPASLGLNPVQIQALKLYLETLK